MQTEPSSHFGAHETLSFRPSCKSWGKAEKASPGFKTNQDNTPVAYKQFRGIRERKMSGCTVSRGLVQTIGLVNQDFHVRTTKSFALGVASKST